MKVVIKRSRYWDTSKVMFLVICENKYGERAYRGEWHYENAVRSYKEFLKMDTIKRFSIDGWYNFYHNLYKDMKF
jgi:hypothetical protein